MISATTGLDRAGLPSRGSGDTERQFGGRRRFQEEPRSPRLIDLVGLTAILQPAGIHPQAIQPDARRDLVQFLLRRVDQSLILHRDRCNPVQPEELLKSEIETVISRKCCEMRSAE